MSRRQWRRPKVYVTRMGRFTFESPWRGALTVRPSTPDFCIDCGTDTDGNGEWFNEDGSLLSEGEEPTVFRCTDHARQWHAEHPPTRLTRLRWKLSTPIDKLYYWYALRFGTRVETSG